jgi:hypothetical protein
MWAAASGRALLLLLNQRDHVSDIVQFLDLSQGKLDLKLPFHREYQLNIRQRVPPGHRMTGRLLIDADPWVVKNISK